jgi:hypothetical protein
MASWDRSTSHLFSLIGRSGRGIDSHGPTPDVGFSGMLLAVPEPQRARRPADRKQKDA